MTRRQGIKDRIELDKELCEYQADYDSLNSDFKEEFGKEIPNKYYEDYVKAHKEYCEENNKEEYKEMSKEEAEEFIKKDFENKKAEYTKRSR